MLKTNTIETAKENERGIVDIETLKKTQENLSLNLRRNAAHSSRRPNETTSS